jgi:hypothetical protein
MASDYTAPADYLAGDPRAVLRCPILRIPYGGGRGHSTVAPSSRNSKRGRPAGKVLAVLPPSPPDARGEG